MRGQGNYAIKRELAVCLVGISRDYIEIFSMGPIVVARWLRIWKTSLLYISTTLSLESIVEPTTISVLELMAVVVKQGFSISTWSISFWVSLITSHCLSNSESFESESHDILQLWLAEIDIRVTQALKIQCVVPNNQ